MPTGSPVRVARQPQRFAADDKRVIARFFQVGGEARIHSILRRVAALSEPEVDSLLAGVLDDFAPRHRNIHATFTRHFGYIRHHVPDADAMSENRRLLVGSYFTMEYAIESAALFNPSIVPHPDQSGLADGQLR
ncbi:MAG: glycosidase, partial [Planctomycetota bacterium]